MLPTKLNLLEEPSPLGLSLRKSPSLQDLIQTRLSQSVGVKKESTGFASSLVGTVEKLKASNFPATILRIGQWEVSFSSDFFSWRCVWNQSSSLVSIFFVCFSINRDMKVIWLRNVTLRNTNSYGKC